MPIQIQDSAFKLVEFSYCKLVKHVSLLFSIMQAPHFTLYFLTEKISLPMDSATQFGNIVLHTMQFARRKTECR